MTDTLTYNAGIKSKGDKALSPAGVFSNTALLIGVLLTLKIIFQLIVLNSGYRWLSADDFTRTVKSFEWLQNPEISSGVWLTPHFWITGFVMAFVKDLVLASNIVSSVFSALCLIYYFKLVEMCFDKRIAFFSSLIFIFFPFQVWLSISGLPEPIFFFFVTTGFYYFFKWKTNGYKTSSLVLAAVSFALCNVFRYEGWFFSTAFVFLVACGFFKKKKLDSELIKQVAISLISFVTVAWWFTQNYIDHKNALFFATETTKIFDQFNTAGLLQRTIQYPSFIFYTAPLTTIFSLKVIFEVLKNRDVGIMRLFLIFNLLQLLLLVIHGMLGTGGTNMISRYIVMNGLLFVPFAVVQAFEFRKWLTVAVISLFVVVNIVWCFYYPQPYREDTFEVGHLTRDLIKTDYVKDKGKIYFEEINGYFDIFAIQALSNHPDRFIFGDLPTIIGEEKSRQNKKQKDKEELNILDIKEYLETNNVQLAIVKSDSYRDKLSKLSAGDEEIGDYKLFYLQSRESNMNDSTISLFAKNVIDLEDNPDLINFNKVLAIKNYEIDNTQFGLNPQTVTIDWTATDEHIIDSLMYDEMEFERYRSVIDFVNVDTDSSVYTITKRIFSERNVETMIERNELRNIIVLEPFALIYYSRKFSSSPFEGGIYRLELSINDTRTNNNLLLYKGANYLVPDLTDVTDTATYKLTDSSKILKKIPLAPEDTLNHAYDLGDIIAMFPDSDFNKIVEKKSDFLEITTQNWMQLLFSQRYQGDQVLNWIFNYF